jgi:outer membrane murein-binding lipoprotein Lpp
MKLYQHKAMWAAVLLAALLLGGCAGNQGSKADPMATVVQVAATAPGLAHQLDNVYAYLVTQKAVPDHLDAATKALAALDAIAPMVQQGAEALQGDNINWVQFVLQAAIVTAQVIGYIAPLL